MPIELEAVFASSRAPKGKHFLFVEDGMSMNKLRDAVHGLFKVHPHQQGLSIVKRVEGEEQPVTVARLDGASRTLGSFAAEGGFGLADAGLQLIVKDYGRQIGYKTVFIVEYLGPILIMMFYAMRPSFLMGAGASARPWHWVAKWGVVAWLLHFIKRELETLYVHKFSRPTMPFFNLFKNSIYYWGFALVVGRCLCDPDYTAPEDVRQVYLGALLMFVAELVNFTVHVQLRNMPPPEGKKREVPAGVLFSLVSCPNYTAEVLSWVGFSIMTQMAFSYAFTVVGFAQMTEWALDKHRGYIKNCADNVAAGKSKDNMAKRRKAIVPFLI